MKTITTKVSSQEREALLQEFLAAKAAHAEATRALIEAREKLIAAGE